MAHGPPSKGKFTKILHSARTKKTSLLDAEAIVLTEVRPHEMLQPLLEELQDLGVSYEATMPTDGQHILGIAQLTKPGVVASNVRLLEGTDLGDSAEYRKALAADVRIGAFDFKIIGVHLKSGRSDDSRDDRSRQATKIAEHIAETTAGPEKDLLVVGDFNMIPPTEEAEQDEPNFEAMNPSNYLRFLSSDFLRQGSFIQGNGQIGNLLDGYAISRTHTREFVGGSLQLVPLYIALGKSRTGSMWRPRMTTEPPHFSIGIAIIPQMLHVASREYKVMLDHRLFADRREAAMALCRELHTCCKRLKGIECDGEFNKTRKRDITFLDTRATTRSP